MNKHKIPNKNGHARADMAKPHEIVSYWLDHPDDLGPGFLAVVVDSGEPACFRCGWRAPIFDGKSFKDVWNKSQSFFDRAHLQAHHLGGSGIPANLVMLCRWCHDWMFASEYDEALDYVRTPPIRSKAERSVLERMSMSPVLPCKGMDYYRWLAFGLSLCLMTREEQENFIEVQGLKV